MSSNLPLPSAIAALSIFDIRSKLAVRPSNPPGCRRVRNGYLTGATLHYNGPPMSVAGNPAAEERFIITTDVREHQNRIGADSLQYHFCILSDGKILYTRDWMYQAWHCGNKEGNEHHLAIHLPIGGAQEPTIVQWESTVRLFEAILKDFKLGSRSAIKGHKEWSSTLCPGEPLMARLKAWRTGETFQGGIFHIRHDVDAANVREGPATTFPVALGGKAIMWPGDTLDADAIIQGQTIGKDSRWLHRRDGLGFVHMSLVKER